MRKALKTYHFVQRRYSVIPAKAGIQWYQTVCVIAYLDSLFQGNDGYRRFFQTVGREKQIDSREGGNTVGMHGDAAAFLENVINAYRAGPPAQTQR